MALDEVCRFVIRDTSGDTVVCNLSTFMFLMEHKGHGYTLIPVKPECNGDELFEIEFALVVTSLLVTLVLTIFT